MLTNEKYALYGKAEALIKTGNYTGAITYFDQAFRIDPNFKDAINAVQMLSDKKGTLYDKGVTLLRDDNYTEAIKYFDKVLAIDPKYDDALEIRELLLITWVNIRKPSYILTDLWP
jgi:tetratricopeptide (TPR) repeat protein